MKPMSLGLIAVLACLSIAPASHARTPIETLIEQTGVVADEKTLRQRPGWRVPRRIVVRDIGLPLDEIRAAVPGLEVIAVRAEAEALERVAGTDAFIGWCSPKLFDAAKDAQWVQVFAAGVERCVQSERIADGSLVLTNMQKMASPVIGEHVIAMVLALARAIPQYARVMPEGTWARSEGYYGAMQSVGGKTLLVAGLGGIGTEVARRAAALDMRVIGTRRSSREGPEFVDYVGLADELPKLAGEADFIVNALPLTRETTRLFDSDFFAAAKRGVTFVNVGRGGTVDHDALVAALRSGQVRGAALDVTDPEPLPPEHPLWQLDNVLITPHVAGAGGNRERQKILLLENLRRFQRGGALLNVVDPERGY